MGDVVIHPNCFKCDNCSGIDFKENENQYTDEEGIEIYRLCKSCSEDLENLSIEEGLQQL